MRKISLIFAFWAFVFCALPTFAQKDQVPQDKIQSVHKVKKQETVYSISKQYGVSIEELQKANPEMAKPNFVLKKGVKLNIPYPGSFIKPVDPLTKHVTVGVMLPLHYINGDGKRMLEYYRGMLLAVKDLKKQGYNIDINTWNVAEDDDIRITLLNENAKKCNIIFGPLYTTQVTALAEFCTSNNIKMIIPFSIKGSDVRTYSTVYQVYQTPSDLTQESIMTYIQTFTDVNTVIIDCDDASSSSKGEFTSGLRKHLEELGRPLQLTSITTPTVDFQKAFSRTKRNMIVLNSSSFKSLNLVYNKLAQTRSQYSDFQISMYGYNEWYLYIKQYEEKMRQYDTYIPSYYNFNLQSPEMQRLDSEYQQYFKTNMIAAIPRFAITGYDQMMFWMHGIHKYGKEFNGTKTQTIDYQPVQTNFEFESINGGGFQNREFILAHFH